MKLIELARLVAGGDTATALFDALTQRVIRLADPRWDWENEATVCECGLLLVELPHPVSGERVVVTLGRAMPVTYTMTHSHVADTDGNVMCPDCADEGRPCGEPHADTLCDAPEPVRCMHCPDGVVLPGQDHCAACRPYEPDWDKDLYPGTYL